MIINSRKTAIVTGATGFIGSNLVKHLLNKNWNVHVIVREKSNLFMIKDVLDRIILHQHDGSTNNMNEIFISATPNIVFHIASLVLTNHNQGDIEPLINSNILFGTQLTEAMVNNGVYRLINTGTSWQHYQNQSYNPVCLYAATKQAFDSILTYYTEVSPLKVITLKLFDSYGPDDPRRKLIPLLLETARTKQALAMSPGKQLIDIVHIDDIVNAFTIAADHLLEDKVVKFDEYAVSSMNPIYLTDIVKIFEKITNINLPIKWGEIPYRSREVMIPWNNGLVLPGWEPRINLEEGIKDILLNN